MPKYKIQLKQGSRTIVNRIEGKTVEHVLDLFNSLTTMQVSEIWGGPSPYFDKTIPPADDFAYYPLVKFIARNEDSGKSQQVILHNVKLTKNTDEIATKIKECLEIDGLKVDSIICCLFKESKLTNH